MQRNIVWSMSKKEKKRPHSKTHWQISYAAWNAQKLDSQQEDQKQSTYKEAKI